MVSFNPFKDMEVLVSKQDQTNELLTEITKALQNMDKSLSATMMMGSGAMGAGMAGGGYGTGGGYGPNDSRPKMHEDQSHRPPPPAPYRSYGGSNYSVGSIRQRAAEFYHANYGVGSGPQMVPHYDVDGSIRGYTQRNPNGSVQYRAADTNIPEANAAAHADYADSQKRAKGSSIAQDVAHNPVTGMIKHIPVIGPAIAAVVDMPAKIADTVVNQRAKNAQFQQIYGGSNFGVGYSNRMQREGFKVSQAFSGGLSGSMAEEAFNDVSALGFQGSQRSTDLNFMVSNYKSLGIGVKQSFQLIETAAKSLNTQLAGVATGLHASAAAARATGQSAQVGMQNYASTYQAIAQVAPGPGAAQLSGALASTVTAMGRNMQGTNITGMFTNPGMLAQGAAAAGLSPTQYIGRIQTNPMAAAQFADKRLAQAANAVLGAAAIAYIKQRVQSLGGPQVFKATPGMSATITQELMDKNMVNAYAAAAYVSSMGIQVANYEAAIQMLVDAVIGTLNFESALKTQTEKPRTSSSTTLSGKAALAGKNDHSSTDSSGTTKTYQHVDGHVQLTTTKNPVVSDAVSKLGKNTSVEVRTASGPRIVSMEEAAKDYTDQLATGTAIIMSGDKQGQSVKTALGGEYEANYYTSGGANTTTSGVGKAGTSSKSQGSAAGEDPTKFAKDKVTAATNTNSKNAGTSGKVVIEPSPYLQQLLTFSPSGNVTIANQSNQSGYPAKPPGSS